MNNESKIRLGLVGVMYGVVLGYGLTFFAQANTLLDYFRFFFAYLVVIIDWVYVHRIYWRWRDYTKVFFFLDLFILFFFSRLVDTSTTMDYSYWKQNYWLWMAALFMLYVVWDIVLKRRKLPSEYRWQYAIIGDGITAIALFGLSIAFLTGKLVPALLLDGIMFAICAIAVGLWFIKEPPSKC